jgi:hypothetical protein
MTEDELFRNGPCRRRLLFVDRIMFLRQLLRLCGVVMLSGLGADRQSIAGRATDAGTASRRWLGWVVHHIVGIRRDVI